MFWIAWELCEWTVKLMYYILVLTIWLAWALVALTIAGVAKMRHNDQLAADMVRSLDWSHRRKSIRRRL